MLVRDRLNRMFRGEDVMVISEHTSKSIKLPVFMLENKAIGMKIIMRDNFYNYKVSVISEKPFIADLAYYGHTSPPLKGGAEYLHPAYFEGFPPEYIFSYYDLSDKMKWSIEINSETELILFFNEIARTCNLSHRYERK